MKQDEADPIYSQALEWFVRMKDEKVAAEERRAFAAWIAADPAHKAAYDRACRLWDRFDIVEPEYRRLRKSGRIGRRDLLLGGLVLLAAVPGAWLLAPGSLLADYKTDVGERRTFTLPDGSMVELGSYSALSAHYTERRRRLVLHRGQGFFQVAADPARPFVVDAGAGATRALGTKFDVKLLDEVVTVSVVAHSVSVTVPAAAAVTVREGWQVSYGAGGLGSPRPADRDRVEAWRRDRIVFEDVPLRHVLRELERYRRGRILLLDDSIGDMPVTAVFEAGQTDAALRAISETLPVTVRNAAGLLTVVYRR